MSKSRPSAAQARILAWAIHRAGGFMRSLDWSDVLTISDVTVVAMVRDGWADRASFYDNARQWRWHWFGITAAARSHPLVIAEIAKLKAYDDAEALASIVADDEVLKEAEQ